MMDHWVWKWFRKTGWAMLWLAWGVQIGGLALMVDSDPYRVVPADRVRVVPEDEAVTSSIQQGKLVVEARAFHFTQMYGNVPYF